MKKVKDYGGMTIIQDPEESVIDTMPKAAMSVTKIDHVMKVEEIIKFLIELNKVTQL